jgi:hypothetical protein
MRFYPKVLGSTQQRVLRRLAPLLTRLNYYLAGGTALAVQLGHRRSVDLDWFTATPIPDPLRLADELRSLGLPFVTGQTERGTLHGAVSGVRISNWNIVIRIFSLWCLGELSIVDWRPWQIWRR